MTSIITKSLHNARCYRALWLYVLIFVVAITMALFSVWAQAGGKHENKFVIPASFTNSQAARSSPLPLAGEGLGERAPG